MRRDHKQFKSQKLIDAKPFRTTKIKSKNFFFRSGVQKQEHVFVMFSPPFSIVPRSSWTRSGGYQSVVPMNMLKPAPRQGNKSRKTSVAEPQGPVHAVVCCDCKSQKLKAMKEGGQTVRPESVNVRVVQKSESGPRGAASTDWSTCRAGPARLPLDCIRMVGQPCRKRSEAYFFFHCWLKNKKHLPNGFQSDESCQGQTMSGEEL